MDADAQHRSVRPGVWHEPMREEHEIAVPFLRDLDAIQTAVVLAGEPFRTRQRLERRVAELPLLLRTRHRRDARLPDLRPRSLHRAGGNDDRDHRAREKFVHALSLTNSKFQSVHDSGMEGSLGRRLTGVERGDFCKRQPRQWRRKGLEPIREYEAFPSYWGRSGAIGSGRIVAESRVL